MELCLQPIATRSRFGAIQTALCQLPKGHTEHHVEYPFLSSLAQSNPHVAQKIRRDATMTTGAAWKSDKAGPNRVLRWAMMLEDQQLLEFGIDMALFDPSVVAKLREKAATYPDCMEVAKKLTWLVYQMPHAPLPVPEIQSYLEAHFGQMLPNSTTCLVCRESLSFTLFALARRGKAEIETAHRNPRLHNAANVGFGHRECNIAQGAKSLDEFYDWISRILEKVRASHKS